uniref:FAM13A-like domain-containing protein n=1 Tax=Fundulus heteroclitus TaxID=8078 RepID=A0A3Q2TMJ9_FUNHE
QLLTVLTRPAQPPRHQPLASIHPSQQPLVSDGVSSPSPHHSPQRSIPGFEVGGGDGSEGGGGALLQLLAGLPSPLPSPRCCSPSLRFNSDPDTAPSPPCSQAGFGFSRCDCDECPTSIPFLTRHIQSLKKRVRKFEDQFEQEMNFKPSHNDKYSNPEMVRVMSELAKARKQLKGKIQPISGSGHQGTSDHKPSLEETVESLFRRLREKRQSLGLPDNIKVCGTKQEKNLVKPLYDRYQMIKRLLCASPTITTIEEEEGSDEESLSSSLVSDVLVPPPCRGTWPSASEEDSDRESDPAFVSPIDEVKAVRPQAALTTANLHEASRSQLLECLRQTRAEKKIRRKVLREFEDEFYHQTGRVCQKEDRTPIKEEYQEYKQLKAKLRLLEVLLSKQDVTKTP